jgi:hypothetical protein
MAEPKSAFLIASLCLVAGCTGYKTANDKVYWRDCDTGSGQTQTLVSGADASTFVPLRHKEYGKDANACYYRGVRIANADPTSFVSLLHYYAKDSTNAFYGDKQISDADGSTFQVLDGNWSRDKSHCFFQTKRVAGADPESFRIIGGYLNAWAADSSSYFFEHERVLLADHATFTILDGGFAKDRARVYFKTKPIEGANPVTFEMVRGTCVGKDEKSYYRFGKKFTPSDDWLKKR